MRVVTGQHDQMYAQTRKCRKRSGTLLLDGISDGEDGKRPFIICQYDTGFPETLKLFKSIFHARTAQLSVFNQAMIHQHEIRTGNGTALAKSGDRR